MSGRAGALILGRKISPYSQKPGGEGQSASAPQNRSDSTRKRTDHKRAEKRKQVSRLCLGALARLSWEERFSLIVKNQVAKANAPARHKTEATQQENGPITSHAVPWRAGASISGHNLFTYGCLKVTKASASTRRETKATVQAKGTTKPSKGRACLGTLAC